MRHKARWIAREHHRHQAAIDNLQPRPSTPAPDTVAMRAELMLIVQAALAELTGDERRVVEASVLRGQSHRTIASDLGLPLGTVKARLRRGKARVRVVLIAAGWRP